MNCKSFQKQLDEALNRSDLSAHELRHLNDCPECRSFQAECDKVREMLQSLDKINAPADFNFRLKARVREQKLNSIGSSPRKLTWLAPVTLTAVVIGGFAVTKSAFDASQPDLNVTLNAPPQQTIQVQSTPNETQIAKISQIPESLTQTVDVSSRAARNAQTKNYSDRREAKKATLARSANRSFVQENRIQSKDVVLEGATTVAMPLGIPDQSQLPSQIDAEQLLLTLGIKTNAETEGLRVISISEQAKRYGLQRDDVIKKINNNDPSSLTNNVLQEIKLTVRRKEGTQQIELTAKP